MTNREVGITNYLEILAERKKIVHDGLVGLIVSVAVRRSLLKRTPKAILLQVLTQPANHCRMRTSLSSTPMDGSARYAPLRL